MKNNPEHSLPELDRRKTQRAVEGVFDKYRIYRTITFEIRESGAGPYTEKTGKPVLGRRTGNSTTGEMDEPAARKQYCDLVDSIVERLDERERLLIRERYMKSDEVFDYKVYNHIFDPPVSKDTYVKIRSRAFYKLALALADLGVITLGSILKKEELLKPSEQRAGSLS